MNPRTLEPFKHGMYAQEDVDYTIKMHGYRFGEYVKCVQPPNVPCAWI